MNIPAEQSKRSVSLRTRLLISSLLGALPLIALGILLLISRFTTRRDLILQSNQTLAVITAASVQGWLEGNIRTLSSLAFSAEAQSGLQAEMQGLVERQQKAQPDWENLSVTNAAGRIIASGTHSTADLSDREFFIQARDTRQPAVSNILTSRVTGRRIIVIAVPIIRDGRFTGIISVAVQPSSIENLFARQFDVGHNTYISLWGSDQRLIATNLMGNRQVGWQYTGDVLDRAFSARRGVFVADGPLTDQRTLLGFATINAAPWVVMAGTPFASAMASIYRDVTLFVILSLVVLGVTLGWSYYSATIVGRRAAQLAAHARAIGEGRFEKPLTFRTGDELEDLANSINQMSADLATLDRLKSELITMVSHELKTPLTAIRASLDLIATGIVTPDQPAYRESLEIAIRQSRRLQDMIDNLINVARLQSGGLMVAPQPTRLNPIVESSVQQYRGAMLARGLELQVDLLPDLCVMADASKITLALNNLLDNAAKFTERGSVIVRTWREENQAVVTVTDTGIGLAPELRERLFTQFYQAEPLLTRHAGGVGLGLWVVRAIIEAHGGRVFVESDGPGAGSTFGFTLPLAEDDIHAA